MLAGGGSGILAGIALANCRFDGGGGCGILAGIALANRRTGGGGCGILAGIALAEHAETRSNAMKTTFKRSNVRGLMRHLDGRWGARLKSCAKQD